MFLNCVSIHKNSQGHERQNHSQRFWIILYAFKMDSIIMLATLLVCTLPLINPLFTNATYNEPTDDASNLLLLKRGRGHQSICENTERLRRPKQTNEFLLGTIRSPSKPCTQLFQCNSRLMNGIVCEYTQGTETDKRTNKAAKQKNVIHSFERSLSRGSL